MTGPRRIPRRSKSISWWQKGEGFPYGVVPLRDCIFSARSQHFTSGGRLSRVTAAALAATYSFLYSSGG
ncbi:MAG: hypothetical protein PHZ19_06425, partial [Candidatus Thermoplasmatota archaeon]|nr:hypothetical protein [Candidatus Thermoplasmatota archaeon]